jgi:hypothetical protein
MVYQDLPEQVLLNKCSNNDTIAFQAIYDHFKAFVFGIVKIFLSACGKTESN